MNTPQYRKASIGEEVVFTNRQTGRFLRGLISFKHEYSTFEDMLLTEGVKNMLPFLEEGDLQQALEVYGSFPGAQRVKEFGCVAIGLKPLEANF